MGQQPARKLLAIGTAVQFARDGKTIHGHLLQRPGRRRRAQVIDAQDRIWVVPAAILEESSRPQRATLITLDDKVRAAFRAGDEVVFTHRGRLRRGTIVKLNPKTAQVDCGDGIWQSPYRDLRQVKADRARGGVERLDAVAAAARQLMNRYGLADWNLGFIESTYRLGDCRYGDRLIRISRNLALDGRKALIRETVLHEIAHALAGREAGHGPLWREVARRIGATPRAKHYEQMR